MPNGDHWEAKGGSRMMVSNDRPLKQTIGIDRSNAIDSAKHELKALDHELARNKEEQKGVDAALMDVSLFYMLSVNFFQNYNLC